MQFPGLCCKAGRPPLRVGATRIQTQVTQVEEEKNVKLKIWAPLASLAVFMMFAGSAFAQDDESASAPDPRLQKMLDGFRSAKPSNAAAAHRSQQQVKSDAITREGTDVCTYPFTSGSGTTYLQFCVTVNGNIVEFQSPAGVEQISQGGYNEGYGICDTSTNVGYYDYADMGDSDNWNSPVLISKTASMVKISRTTSDGLWVLTQTITNSPGPNPSAKVLMQLKNNSSQPKGALLMRYADVDPGNAAGTDMYPDGYLESFDSSLSSAWGYVPQNGSDSGAPSYGLMFQNVGNPVPASVPYGRQGLVQNFPDGPYPCDPSLGYAAPLANTDGSIVYLWAVVLNKEQAVSVTGKYFSF
jgi:hypothetical protein